MTLQINEFIHPPAPAHLVGIHRLGISIARWASNAAEARAVREQAELEQVRIRWENRCELAQLERQRELLWSQLQLHQLR
jgi:hypothetical protein